jgi:hypothetical protein
MVRNLSGSADLLVAEVMPCAKGLFLRSVHSEGAQTAIGDGHRALSTSWHVGGMWHVACDNVACGMWH